MARFVCSILIQTREYCSLKGTGQNLTLCSTWKILCEMAQVQKREAGVFSEFMIAEAVG